MDTWTQTQGLTAREAGFRTGYETGFGKAFQGLAQTIPGGWAQPETDAAGRLPGEWWQVGWRQGWVAGCQDGHDARLGEVSLCDKGAAR